MCGQVNDLVSLGPGVVLLVPVLICLASVGVHQDDDLCRLDHGVWGEENDLRGQDEVLRLQDAVVFRLAPDLDLLASVGCRQEKIGVLVDDDRFILAPDRHRLDPDRLRQDKDGSVSANDRSLEDKVGFLSDHDFSLSDKGRSRSADDLFLSAKGVSLSDDDRSSSVEVAVLEDEAVFLLGEARCIYAMGGCVLSLVQRPRAPSRNSIAARRAPPTMGGP